MLAYIEAFFRTHSYLVNHTKSPVRRLLMDEIDWTNRMIGIKGTRGIGKTTFLLEYAKEKFGSNDPRCLYINMNNFYFQGHNITDFARDFVSDGGEVLLIDQVFKKPNWSKELRECYDFFPDLKIIFTGSSVMNFEEEYPELKDILMWYELTGFSFREYLNLDTDNDFQPIALDDIINYHEEISEQIRQKVNPAKFFKDYLHHGFYPFHLEKRNFSENLLKTVNMMAEVDILLINQIELKYLAKIKKLFYLLAVEGAKSPNVSNLSHEIGTSRATVMNYIKYLEDARLIHMIYPVGQTFPKKPSKIIMQNPNLTYAIYPIKVIDQELIESFVINMLWKNHDINEEAKKKNYILDKTAKYSISNETNTEASPYDMDAKYTMYYLETEEGDQIPLWLLGFLY